MEVKLKENCKLFIFQNSKVEEIESSKVSVFFNGLELQYKLKENSKNEIIVQAMNQKKAIAKILTIWINKYG